MRALYITYDGLLDQIGSSQILPYLKSINHHLDDMYVLSFEKKDKYLTNASSLDATLDALQIKWIPLRFSEEYGVFGKVFDLIKMHVIALKTIIRNNINIVHARGHIAGETAALLKYFLPIKVIFDCRGLWAEEKINKGGWNLENPLDRFQYKLFKKIEKKVFTKADHIIVLTNKVIKKIKDNFKISNNKLTVIPCCADFNHFTILEPAEVNNFKIDQGIDSNALILGYLGSIGNMYRFHDYIKLVTLANSKNGNVRGLVITQDKDKAEELIREICEIEKNTIFHIFSAERNEVPKYINLFDVMINFLTSSEARIGTSPTRNAECFAAGVPVMCSAGIGDVDHDINILDAGIILNKFDEQSLLGAVDKLDEIIQKGGLKLREASKEVFSLDVAEQRYKKVYSHILNNF